MNFVRHYATRSHLDFFAIDYNEELSGVYGHYLQNQTFFLNQAIKVIKRLYYKKNKDDVKLIVIAHSFGGVLFRGLLNLSSFNLDDIFLYLTLATPHHRAVFAFDSSFYAYYSQINQQHLKSDLANYEKYQNLAKISIGGGLNDNLVRSDLTNIQNELNQWSLTSSSMPEVWVAADHKCIVWCKQLVKKLVHLVFDLLEERLNDERLTNRNQIIEHHLNNRFNDRLTLRYRLTTSLDDQKSKKYEINKRLFSVDKLKVIDTLIYQFKLTKNTYTSIVSTNLHRSDWIYVCGDSSTFASSLNCLNAKQYTNQPIPSIHEFNGIKRNHFILDSNLYLAQNLTSLALKMSPSTIRSGFRFERIINERRNKEISSPSLLSRLIWFFSPFQTILKVSIAEESTFYNLTLNNFNQIWQNYNLRLEIGKCYAQAKEDTILVMASPWYREDRFFVIETKKDSTFNTVLNLNVPNYDKDDERKINLRLLLDSHCEYRLKMKFSLRETIIQLFRHYAFLFLPITTSILLSAFSIQIRSTSNCKENADELIERTEFYLSLKSILIGNINEMTCFGILPSLPHLVHLTLNRLLSQFNFDNYLESNLFFIKFTRHNSHYDSLFASYLIFIFIYFILYIIIHLFSYLFTLIINFNQFIYLNRYAFSIFL